MNMTCKLLNGSWYRLQIINGDPAVGWGSLSQLPPIINFHHFFWIIETVFSHRIHIWQVLPQPSCGNTCQIWMWFNRSNKISGGERVTRFPFGLLNVLVYISHWAARVNSENRLHFEGDYRNWWLTHMLLGAIQLAASGSNMKTYLCKIGTWYN